MTQCSTAGHRLRCDIPHADILQRQSEGCLPGCRRGRDWGPLLLRDTDISPEALAEIRALVYDVRSGAARESCDFRLRDKASGKEQWHRLSLSGVGGEDGGAPRRLIGIIEDISEAKGSGIRSADASLQSQDVRRNDPPSAGCSAFPAALCLFAAGRGSHQVRQRYLRASHRRQGAGGNGRAAAFHIREEDILGGWAGTSSASFFPASIWRKAVWKARLPLCTEGRHDILKGPAGESPDVSFSCGAVLCCARHSLKSCTCLRTRLCTGSRKAAAII